MDDDARRYQQMWQAASARSEVMARENEALRTALKYARLCVAQGEWPELWRLDGALSEDSNTARSFTHDR